MIPISTQIHTNDVIFPLYCTLWLDYIGSCYYASVTCEVGPHSKFLVNNIVVYRYRG